MHPKTAKTAAKATGSKNSASKVAAKAPMNKTAPKAPAAKTVAKPVSAPAKPAAAAPRVEEKKVVTQRQGFKANEFVVYPAHGVGQILAIEEQEIAGAKLELFVINFMKDKMTLRVPTAKVANVGMRKLSEPALVKKALETLKGRARVKRTMWSRRAQEYKLNQAITREARRHPGYERQVLDFYRQNPQAVANLRAPIFEDKVVDFIVELAKVEERKISPQDLLSLPDSDADGPDAGGPGASGPQASGPDASEPAPE